MQLVRRQSVPVETPSTAPSFMNRRRGSTFLFFIPPVTDEHEVEGKDEDEDEDEVTQLGAARSICNQAFKEPTWTQQKTLPLMLHANRR